MNDVVFRKAEYDYAVLKPAVFDMIDSICGTSIEKGMKVLIKPNMLLPAKPEFAVISHPLVVRAAAEYVLEKGASVQISDSPAVALFDKILRDGGYRKAFQGLDVEFKMFKTSVKVDIKEPFGFIDISKDAMEADYIINIAKLKTHAQMFLTLGVKNLFGCIVGMKKPEWHLRSGISRKMFASLVVRICRAVNPQATIVDGILGMEGQGPGKGGTPRYLGMLIGGKSAFAVDVAICKMLGINPDILPTNKAAKEMNLTGYDINMTGDFKQVNNFVFPFRDPLVFGPRSIQKTMRRHFIQRPLADNSLCRLCGECWKYCPAGSIAYDKEKIIFDYEKCIRCYCCIEVCPEGALKAVETLPGKLIRKLLIK
ncbi:MAG: DUF362 domain-containing protein [Proteobacteria bacterium]|nr:DUF362 domain-containing protein [Pseudomonadota bacterium]MBU4037463.1 DUF362 domain-containing protein [Pseudomonadota bacterium]